MNGLPQYAQVSLAMMDNCIKVGRRRDGCAYKKKTQAVNPLPGNAMPADESAPFYFCIVSPWSKSPGCSP
jgi:hypothetical protein